MRMKSLDYPQPSSPAVSRVMRANRKVDSRPERLLRSEMWRMGLRFRKYLRVALPGRSVVLDAGFERLRLALFVDGCFWHGCPLHGNVPRTNSNYWTAKLERNLARDVAVNRALVAQGWAVLRVWEHDDPSEAAERVRTTLEFLRSLRT